MLIAPFVDAAIHVIEMRNSNPEDPNEINLFTPPLIKIELGDTVRFAAIDSGHNGASKNGVVPEGAESWNGGIDEELELTFDVEGTYGYLCSPHYQMGMIGLILVGDYTGNLETANKVRHVGTAKRAFRDLIKQVEERDSD